MIAARAVRAAAALRTLSRASVPRPPMAVASPACVGAAAVGARFLAAMASPTTTSTTPPTPAATDAKVRISRHCGLGGGGEQMKAIMAATVWLLTVLGQRACALAVGRLRLFPDRHWSLLWASRD